MKVNEAQYYETKSEVLKALAHPTRLMIAHSLIGGEQCVCVLNELVDIEQPTLSRHLRVMKDAGILTSRKDGMNVYYHLTRQCLVENIIKCLGVIND